MSITTLKRAIKRRLIRSTPKLTSYSGVPSVIVAYNEYGAYCLPRAALHRPACQAVLNGDVWERETIAFMSANCANADIVHAGTFFGDFLPALSRAAGAGGKIWAFEPSSANHYCAKTTICLNNLWNIELLNAALGSASSRIGFSTVNAQGKALGGASHFDPAGGTETVTQVRIDDVVPVSRQVAILQLDVEGYEREALRGGQETIRRCRPIIILETVPTGFATEYRYDFKCRLAENSVFTPV
jgi:FkbM family methyltransferase